MGSIVAISSGKGGCGKTTATVLLATCLAHRGRRVTLIDADPNDELARLGQSIREGRSIDVLSVKTPDDVVEAAQTAADDAVVLIDTAGFANLAATSAIAASDAVLIPCVASGGSVWEAVRTYALGGRVSGGAKPRYVLRSNWAVRGLAEGAALEDLTAAGAKCLDTAIPALAVYKQMLFTGSLPPGRGQDVGFQLIDELESKGLIGKIKRKRK